MTSGWSWYVMAIVVLNLIGCVWLLRSNTKRSPNDPKPDETGHVWDGNLTEYNKPLPRWWINLFYITIVFGIGYLAWYPGLGALPGAGRYSQRTSEPGFCFLCHSLTWGWKRAQWPQA